MEQEFQAASGAPAGTVAIDRAAQLLTLVLEAERPRALGDLAGDAELPKSTASRLLAALERQGLVEQQGRRGSFVPGPVMLRFAHRRMLERHLAELSEPHLRVLSELSGETINLAVPAALGVEHVAQAESRHYLGTGQWIGRRVPYHCTAVGKVLVAFGAATLPPGPLEPVTPATITDRARLAAVIDKARRDGYATAVDELETGLASVAAPVLGAGGAAVAALAISGPTLRMDADELTALRGPLLDEARALGARLDDHDKGERAA